MAGATTSRSRPTRRPRRRRRPRPPASSSLARRPGSPGAPSWRPPTRRSPGGRPLPVPSAPRGAGGRPPDPRSWAPGRSSSDGGGRPLRRDRGRHARRRRGDPGSAFGSDVDASSTRASWLHPHVVLYDGTVLGPASRSTPGRSSGRTASGTRRPRRDREGPQAGRVVVEDDVEIGANACVDRRRWRRRGWARDEDRRSRHDRATTAGSAGTESSAGRWGWPDRRRSATASFLGGQVGVAGHLTIGHRVKAGAQSGSTATSPTASRSSAPRTCPTATLSGSWRSFRGCPRRPAPSASCWTAREGKDGTRP